MAKNKNLHSAKVNKNDEFYTQLSDIENELKHYREHFKDKTVFCNCDDPEWSNFWRFFNLNFDFLGLKRLLATHYETEKQSYMLEMYRDDSGVHTEIRTLKQNGDFRSPECLELLEQADIVVTNPPFSLFRDYVNLLVQKKKQFLIIGNKNAITYKEIFPLIKNNDTWLGYNHGKGTMLFSTPAKEIKSVPSYWYTNLEHSKRNEEMILYREFNEVDYPRYDNYLAWNVDKVVDIPQDDEIIVTVNTGELEKYKEVYPDLEILEANKVKIKRPIFGVPITFLNSYNPKQFEIVSFRKGEDGKDLAFTREREFNRTFESWFAGNENGINRLWTNEQSERYKSEWEKQICKDSNKKKEPIDVCYPSSTNLCGVIKNAEGSINGENKYARILIRRKLF